MSIPAQREPRTRTPALFANLKSRVAAWLYTFNAAIWRDAVKRGAFIAVVLTAAIDGAFSYFDFEGKAAITPLMLVYTFVVVVYAAMKIR